MRKDVIKRSKILIVDDQEANVALLVSILRERGFIGIQSLTDARLVLPLFAEFEPDLVVLDLRMPHVGGLSLLKQLRSRIPEGEYLPFLIVSGDSSEQSKQAALTLGAKDFLTKPLRLTEAVLRIYNLLETRFLYLELQEQNRLLDERVRERTRDLQLAHDQILRHLALAADYRDDLTGLHAQRVGLLAALLAQTIGVPEEEVKLIRGAAPLHDLGKIGIPDHILLKSGKLTQEEFEVVKTHVAIGGRILSGSSFPLLKMAEQIARYHHEHWDGSGYLSIKGDAIPLAARVTAIADTFDVLTHSRPYKSASPLEEVLAEITKERGRQFDPELVDALLKLVAVQDLLNLDQALLEESGPVLVSESALAPVES
ncbi:MAG: rpfG 6 [Bryobacterales bacterium]|nr:rpfG 6 [Bryobacterales bacterium]